MKLKLKQGISPVVATALLLIVAVVAVTSFHTWFSTFNSVVLSDIEYGSSVGSMNTYIETVIGSDLYFHNGFQNITINDIKIDGISCALPSSSYLRGMQKIDLGRCISNMNSAYEVVVFTDKGIFSKQIIIKVGGLPFDCSSLNGEWINVPGNSDLGTSDFCVMKFEAKFANLTGKSQDATYLGWRFDTATGDMNITSSSINEPITYANQQQAKDACKSLGANYHLITNAEWTTIARNAEQNPDNWDSGIVGTGKLNRGHSDNDPNYLLPVLDETDNYTGTLGSSPENRVLELSNGEKIWDMGGNVMEWTNNNCSQNSPWYTGSAWIEWDDLNLIDTNQEKNLAGATGDYNSSNNIGKYFGCTAEGNGFLRGGAWYLNENSGPFSLFLMFAPTDAGYSLGFRCVYG